jgi:eukaryotic-like serine/threonine-protein kinase
VTAAATLLDDRYLLEEQIAAGGFCEVWRAADTVLMRPVAVKLLHAVYADQPEAQARFEAEARHAGALSHENIARIYDYGERACGPSYLVMELIDGPSLATVLSGGPLDAARTMDVVAQVAAGLDAAHNAGLIHRDVKPENILFTSEGIVRITDFGIAHAVGSAPLTATGLLMGTPGYLAPERVAGARGGPASDLYSLGIVAYECLAGRRPFEGSALEVATAHRDHPLPPLPAPLPAEVAAFVMMLTAKHPASRPASADAAALHARRLRDGLASGTTGAPMVPAGARPAITGVRNGQTRRDIRSQARAGRTRRPRLLGPAAVALTALACLALITVTWLAHASRPATRPSSPAAAPSVTKSRPARVSAHRAGQQPSLTPNTGIGVAAIKRRSTPQSASRPGRHPLSPGSGPSLAPSTSTSPTPSAGPSPSPAPSPSPVPSPSSSP